MKYIHITSIEPVVEYLSNVLIDNLRSGKKVLWLMSGGSGGKVCVEVSKRLSGTNLDNLYVTMTDERFGPVGHDSENWQQLLNDGFELSGAKLYRPLIGLDRSSTTDQFGRWLEDTYQKVDYKIGIFGVGTDAHTAGIKPATSSVDAQGWATEFDGEDFERFTMTFDAISKLDEAVLQAMGKDKESVIDDILSSDIDIKIQPVQILKKVPKFTVFTDYKDNDDEEEE